MYTSGLSTISFIPSREGPSSPPVPHTILVPTLCPPRTVIRASPCKYFFFNTLSEPASSNKSLSTLSPLIFSGESATTPSISDICPVSPPSLIFIEAFLCILVLVTIRNLLNAPSVSTLSQSSCGHILDNSGFKCFSEKADANTL